MSDGVKLYEVMVKSDGYYLNMLNSVELLDLEEEEMDQFITNMRAISKQMTEAIYSVRKIKQKMKDKGLF